MFTKLFAPKSSWRYAYPVTNTQEDYLLGDIKYYNRHFSSRHFTEKYTSRNKPLLHHIPLEVALYQVNVYYDMCPSDLSILWKKCAVDIKHDLYLVSGCEADYILDNYPCAKFYEVR